MQEEAFPVIQIVGYKNAGKTTLMTKMISYLTAKDLRVASLKHHGHASELRAVPDTDSAKHHRAGAVMAGVQSASQFQLHIQPAKNLAMKEIMSMYALMDIDILLLEGFKQADYPKIVLLRNDNDKALLKLSNIVAVGVNKTVENAEQDKTFSLNDLDNAIPWLVNLCLKRR